MINNITIEGNITNDLEIKQIKNGEDSVINFSIANHLYKKEEPEFIKCSIFGKRAESMFNYCEKGNRVLIEGELKSKSYTKEIQGESVRITNNYVQVGQYRKIEIPSSRKSSEELQNKESDNVEENNSIDDNLPF